MPSNGAPLYLWRREAQACGDVRWYLYRGLTRTRLFVERPTSALDRVVRHLPYVLCCASGDGRGHTRDEAAYKTLELAQIAAEVLVGAIA